MISSTGYVELAFEEPDLQTTTPQCAAFVAAALANGWPLIKDGGFNLLDAYVGSKHVQDCRKLQMSKTRRVIVFRFAAVEQLVMGEKMNLHQFHGRCLADATFYRHVSQHPKRQKKLRLLLEHFAKQQRHFDVTEGNAHDRRLIIPAHGGDQELIARLATRYEGGW